MANKKMRAADDRVLTPVVVRIKPILSDIKNKLVDKGAAIEGDLPLNKVAHYIENEVSASKSVTGIKIKHYSGQTLDWLPDGKNPHRLEIESITPEDASVELREIQNLAVKWTSSDPSVVKIVESEEGGTKVYDAIVAGSGECTITAEFLGVTDSFTVAMEYKSDFHTLRDAVRRGTAESAFPVGTEIADTWEDTAAGKSYSMPLVVAHYGDVVLADGTVKAGVYLVRKNATPFAMQFDAADSKHSNGYNRYSASGIHKWLNSDADKNQWWSASHSGDNAPDIASTKDGYMKGCSAALLDAIAEVKINVSTNTVTDGGVTDEINCKFFLPSREQLHFVPGASNAAAAGVEGEAWDYFKTVASPTDSARPIRVFKNPSGTAQPCWLRSAYRGFACNVWGAATDGSAYYLIAYAASACAPACVLRIC